MATGPLPYRLAGLALALAGCVRTQTPAAPKTVPTPAAKAAPYLTALPAGEKGPSNAAGQPVRPKVVDGFAGPPPTHEWWSSLIWPYDRAGTSSPHSQPLYAHPLAAQAEAGGLGIGYPSRPKVDGRGYSFPYARDLLIGTDGLAAAATRVAGHGDWTVTASWDGRLLATLGHGLPYAQADVRGRARVEVTGAAAIDHDGGDTIGLTVNGHHYGLFVPRGRRWAREGQAFVADLGGGGPFAVAVLPDASASTLQRFRRHAFAFVTDTRIDWRYDEATATLTTRFGLRTTPRERGAPAETLTAVYPHQWKLAAVPTDAPVYASPRGPMKVIATTAFETRHRFTGVLPVLPVVSSGAAPGRLRTALRDAARAADLFPVGPEGTKGTYWTGKSLGKVAALAWLADQSGETVTRDRFLRETRAVLADWFDGRLPNAFHHDRTWGALIGLPAEYQSGRELNDHHFHYAYYLFAAATVAAFDPGFVAAHGEVVDLLIRDVANPDRGDRRFPFLRHFDPYAGHSWANGPAHFPEGNNQESSSEEVNFAAALVLWGEITGRRVMRDLGIFLYTQAVSAVQQYWFDVDREVFPDGFDRPAVGIVWGSGARYDTWWDGHPSYVHGINFLPFTGGSLYLGHRPDYVRENHGHVVRASGGQVRIWPDLHLMFQALAEPEQALASYLGGALPPPEFGNSAAFLVHWLDALAAFGRVNPAITADVSTFAVFDRGRDRTHAAFNPGPAARTVTFSDGVRLTVPPRAIAHSRR